MHSPSFAARQEPAIDWYPFLARPQLPAATAAALAHLREASILVTGAGGSIGSALSRKLAALRPQKLVLLDASEQALYRLLNTLPGDTPQHKVTYVLGSITDGALFEQVLTTHRPTILFHTAAHKHVALLEDHPLAAITNNALGTNILVQLGMRQRVCRLILLSTDKAVAPASILGATKRIAEQITLATGGVALRLCNVLDTEGSVVDAFLRQLHSGRPLSIVHPEAERYFITLDEAVDLLLNSTHNHPPGSLLVPQLSQAHRITSLASYLARCCSLQEPISFDFIGMRPGEKLNESLWAEEELPTASPSTGCTQLQYPGQNLPQLAVNLNGLQTATQARDLKSAIEIVRQLVPSYTPSQRILTQLQHTATGVLQA